MYLQGDETMAKKAVVKQAKKSPAKKVVARKVSKPTSVARKPMKAIKDPLTKSELINEIIERVNSIEGDKTINRKVVSIVLETIFELAANSLKKGCAGKFNIPDLCTLVALDIPAKKARKGINPFTGEETMFKAKPASRKVKIRPLKKLKDAASK